MNAADREWVLAIVELMCKANSSERLDEIGKAVAVDLNEEPCYISARAAKVVLACGAATRECLSESFSVGD